jgi:hypothetical protein
MVAFGVMCGYVTAAIFNNVKGNWRYMLGSSVVYSTILFFGMLLMPESSRWLMQKGRKLDSYLVWKTIRGFETPDERTEFFVMEKVILTKRTWRRDDGSFWIFLRVLDAFEQWPLQ